jgi:hypothetical protein
MHEKPETPKRSSGLLWQFFAVQLILLTLCVGPWALIAFLYSDPAAEESRFVAAGVAALFLGSGYLVMRLRRRAK